MDPYVNKLIQLIKSRKFWAAIVAIVVALFGERAGMSEAAMVEAVAAIVAYILGVALEDGLSRSR